MSVEEKKSDSDEGHTDIVHKNTCLQAFPVAQIRHTSSLYTHRPINIYTHAYTNASTNAVNMTREKKK